MSRVLIVSPDSLDDRMAGPAIRAWSMAEVLAPTHEVRLLSTATATRTSPQFIVRAVDDEGLAGDGRWADVAVVHPSVLRTHADVAPPRLPVVVDLYDPFHLENLEPNGRPLEERTANVAHLNSVINDGLHRGDYFLCASARQRDFWLGSLTAAGRVNPSTYDADPTLAALIGIAPFGIAGAPPARRRPAMRGVIPGIGEDDRILLWGGGVYNWFDPVTLIEAVDLVRRRVPNVRLVFLGMTHPNPHLPPMHAATEARRRSEERGLTGTHVFFNEGWIPYDERADYLLEADIGVSTHGDHIETAFAFRTRMLDYLWGGLPIVTSEGDVFAELAMQESIGAAAPPGDARSLATAIEQLLTDPDRLAVCRANARRVAESFHWENTLRPLAEFCQAPHVAPDRLAALGDEASDTAAPFPDAGRRRRFWRTG